MTSHSPTAVLLALCIPCQEEKMTGVGCPTEMDADMVTTCNVVQSGSDSNE